MLNMYNYHTDPKSLAKPSDEIVRQWDSERKDNLSHFQRDLWALEDDYDVHLAHNVKPNGEVWYSAAWGRDGKLNFYIPHNSFIAYVIGPNHQVTDTYNDPNDIVNMLADELNSIGAHRQEEEWADDDEGYYGEDEYDD